jgi:hypothetical protein
VATAENISPLIEVMRFGYAFLSSMLFVQATWVILYRLTDSVAAALALVGVQLLVVGYCYAQYRKALAANPAPAR